MDGSGWRRADMQAAEAGTAEIALRPAGGSDGGDGDGQQ